MRLALVVTVVGALLVLWVGTASAQDSCTQLKPDLPLVFPAPRSSDPAEDPDETERASRARDGTVVAGKDDPKTPGTNDGRDSTPATPGEDGRDSTPTTPGEDGRDSTPTTPGEDGRDSTPTTPGEGDRDSAPTAPGEDGRDSTPAAPGEDGSTTTPPEETTTAPGEDGRTAPGEEGPTAPPEETTTIPPPETTPDTPPIEEGSTTPPIEEGSSTPPEEEGPRNPPPEFFDEPIETAEVIYVIDCTGSMSWPAGMSVEDINGGIHNNASKMAVAKIELVKSISNLAENVKFAMVAYATNIGTPAWPTHKVLMPATPENKASAISWAQGMPMGGYTNTGDAMAVALGMVTPAPANPGPGGEQKKSPTAMYLLTDGLPNRLRGQVFNSTSRECMELTKAYIISLNVHQAVIFTLGIGLGRRATVNMQEYLWCLEFLTELAEATGGHFREVAK